MENLEFRKEELSKMISFYKHLLTELDALVFDMTNIKNSICGDVYDYDLVKLSYKSMESIEMIIDETERTIRHYEKMETENEIDTTKRR